MSDLRTGSRDAFPTLEWPAYLNYAAISPPSVRVQERVERLLRDYARRGFGAFMEWLEQKQRLRVLLAELLHAHPDEVALTAGTTATLTQIAFSIPWQRGERVILFDGEFPANVTPWQQAAATFGVEPVFLPLDGFGDGSGRGLQRLEDELRRGGARVVAVSAVQFKTGLRMPLADIAALAHLHHAEIAVDAIQALGVIDLDVEGLGIDYLASGAHKWLMGLEGCGLGYIAPQALERLVPRAAGWLSHEHAIDFLVRGPGHLRYDRPVRRRADLLEGGAYNSAGFAALEAAVETLLELELHAIWAHTQSCLDRLEPGLLALGFASWRAIEPDARSGILSLTPPDDIDVIALAAALTERGVACSTPDGLLRFAAHWPTTDTELDHTLNAAGDALTALRTAR